MPLTTFPVESSFSGADADGWLTYPNRFICPKCGFGVSFTQQSLTNAASYVWKKVPRQSKLHENLPLLFQAVVDDVMAKNADNFVLDFHCPKCSSAYTLAFEINEFHMAAYRFRPLAVWGVLDAAA